MLHAPCAVIVKKQRAGLPVEPNHAQQQTEVPDPGSDERFLGSGRRCRPFIPKTNQQVRGQAHHLPTHKQQQQAVGDQQAQHRSREEGEEAEEPREVFVVVHIRHAVNEDQQPHKRDHHQHDRCQRVQHPAKLHPFRSELHPLEVEEEPRRLRQHVGKGNHRQHQRKRHGDNRDRGRQFAPALLQQRTNAGGDDGECRYQPQIAQDCGNARRQHPIEPSL